MQSNETYFCTFNDSTVKIHLASTGAVLATKMPPLSGGAKIVNASCDTTANYITISCSNRKIYVFKKQGPSSWTMHKQYLS